MEITPFYHLVRVVAARFWPFKTVAGESFWHSPFFHHACLSPLTTILLTSQLALQSPQPPQHLEEHLKTIQTQAEYLSLLLQPQQQRQTTFNVNQAIREVVIRLHQPLLGHHLSAVLHCSPDVKLEGHHIYFQETLSCLLTNAFESYPRHATYRSVSLTCHTHNNQLTIMIKDGGRGMTRVDRWLAAQQGFSRKGKHRGLGLAFVIKTIQTHFQGQLDVVSRPGWGTLVVLTLPIVLDQIPIAADSFNQTSLRA